MKKIHFIGIGGQGVSAVAETFADIGIFELSGSDLNYNARFENLRGKGVKIKVPHDKNLISNDISIAICSPVIPDTNVEIVECKKRNIPIVEFVDVERFLLDKFFYEKELNLNEYKASIDDLNVLEDIFSDLDNISVKSACLSNGLGVLFNFDLSWATVIGVTGTDGKTTTSTMMYHVLRQLGKNVGLISTVEAKIGNAKGEKHYELGLHVTTPSATEILVLLDIMRKNSCDYVIIEVTSHGIAQQRIAGINFDAVVYTNITNEHLDYHGTWENYAFTKSLLISKYLKPNGFAVINQGDKSFDLLNSVCDDNKIRKYRYLKVKDLKGDADVLYRIKANKKNVSEIPFDIIYKDQKLSGYIPIIGDYNIDNFAACFTCLTSLGLSGVVESIKNFETVKGRMNVLQASPFAVIVDFAHTPNALDVALKTIKDFIKFQGNGKIHVVFGCAGLRDKYKRPVMGNIAEKYADFVYLTAEDPRTEVLKDINNQILSGMSKCTSREKLDDFVEKYETSSGKIVYSFFEENVNSRLNALKMAIKNAQHGDVVIATGKGHEESLCFGRTENKWNDTDVINEILNNFRGEK